MLGGVGWVLGGAGWVSVVGRSIRLSPSNGAAAHPQDRIVQSAAHAAERRLHWLRLEPHLLDLEVRRVVVDEARVERAILVSSLQEKGISR